MKDVIHYGLVLFIIASIAGVGLYGVNEMTKDRIAEASRATLAAGQRIAFPEAASFSDAQSFPVNGSEGTYFDVYDKDGTLIGYEVVYAVQGYQSQVKVLTGLRLDGHISGIRVLSQAETPGLGAEVEAVPSTKTLWSAIGDLLGGARAAPEEAAPQIPTFQAQFTGKTLDQLVVVKQPTEENIEAISGATITSAAVVKAVREPAEAFLAWIKQRETRGQRPEVRSQSTVSESRRQPTEAAYAD